MLLAVRQHFDSAAGGPNCCSRWPLVAAGPANKWPRTIQLRLATKLPNKWPIKHSAGPPNRAQSGARRGGTRRGPHRTGADLLIGSSGADSKWCGERQLQVNKSRLNQLDATTCCSPAQWRALSRRPRPRRHSTSGQIISPHNSTQASATGGGNRYWRHLKWPLGASFARQVASRKLFCESLRCQTSGAGCGAGHLSRRLTSPAAEPEPGRHLVPAGPVGGRPTGGARVGRHLLACPQGSPRRGRFGRPLAAKFRSPRRALHFD